MKRSVENLSDFFEVVLQAEPRAVTQLIICVFFFGGRLVLVSFRFVCLESLRSVASQYSEHGLLCVALEDRIWRLFCLLSIASCRLGPDREYLFRAGGKHPLPFSPFLYVVVSFFALQVREGPAGLVSR